VASNAGVNAPRVFRDMTDAAFDRMVEVNLKGGLCVQSRSGVLPRRPCAMPEDVVGIRIARLGMRK